MNKATESDVTNSIFWRTTSNHIHCLTEFTHWQDTKKCCTILIYFYNLCLWLEYTVHSVHPWWFRLWDYRDCYRTACLLFSLCWIDGRPVKVMLRWMNKRQTADTQADKKTTRRGNKEGTVRARTRKTNSYGMKTNLEGEPLHLENALWQQIASTDSRLSLISCSKRPGCGSAQTSFHCLITYICKGSGKGLESAVEICMAQSHPCQPSCKDRTYRESTSHQSHTEKAAEEEQHSANNDTETYTNICKASHFLEVQYGNVSKTPHTVLYSNTGYFSLLKQSLFYQLHAEYSIYILFDILHLPLLSLSSPHRAPHICLCQSELIKS